MYVTFIYACVLCNACMHVMYVCGVCMCPTHRCLEVKHEGPLCAHTEGEREGNLDTRFTNIAVATGITDVLRASSSSVSPLPSMFNYAIVGTSCDFVLCDLWGMCRHGVVSLLDMCCSIRIGRPPIVADSSLPTTIPTLLVIVLVSWICAASNMG